MATNLAEYIETLKVIVAALAAMGGLTGGLVAALMAKKTSGESSKKLEQRIDPIAYEMTTEDEGGLKTLVKKSDVSLSELTMDMSRLRQTIDEIRGHSHDQFGDLNDRLSNIERNVTLLVQNILQRRRER